MNQKNLLLVLIGLIVGFAGGYFTRKSMEGGEKPGGNSTVNRQPCDPEIEDTSTQTRTQSIRGRGITRKEAKEMYDAYKANWVGNRAYRTRSLWFSYKEIEDYLKDIRTEIKDDPSNIGIRFYFGAKPEVIQGYKNRLTMFMVPTYGVRPHQKDTISEPLKIIGGYNNGDLCPPDTTCGLSAFEPH